MLLYHRKYLDNSEITECNILYTEPLLYIQCCTHVYTQLETQYNAEVISVLLIRLLQRNEYMQPSGY